MMKPIDGLESMLLKNNAPIANNNLIDIQIVQILEVHTSIFTLDTFFNISYTLQYIRF